MNFSRRYFFGLGAAAMAAGYVRHPAMADETSTAWDPAILDHVDPELRGAARQAGKMQATTPPLSDHTLQMARRAGGYSAKALPGIPARLIQIPGHKDSPPVSLYIVNERAGMLRPAIVHTHGGGFVMGTAAQSVRGMQEIAKALDCVIITVDYRLAPETDYAGSIEDNYSALRWLYSHAESIGADRRRIAVMGESAGGGHAALLAITARDRGEIPLIYQCLIYPMLDDRTGSSHPVAPTVGKIGWSAADNRYGWRAFLGRTPGTAGVPARAVPARVASVAGLPPAFIGVGSLDLFVAEDVDYAQRLIEAGIGTELVVVPGAFHGFDGFASKEVAQRFNKMKLDALRRALNPPV